MRTYKLTIAYDGTAYQGWQRQANTENTLQGTLERTISSVAGYPVEIDGSGLNKLGGCQILPDSSSVYTSSA